MRHKRYYLDMIKSNFNPEKELAQKGYDVEIGVDSAKQVYDWAEIGTPVIIHK